MVVQSSLCCYLDAPLVSQTSENLHEGSVGLLFPRAPVVTQLTIYKHSCSSPVLFLLTVVLPEVFLLHYLLINISPTL